MVDTQIGVFFLEEDPMIRELLRGSCPEEYQVLGGAATCQEVRDKIPELVAFDGVLVTILDYLN